MHITHPSSQPNIVPHKHTNTGVSMTGEWAQRKRVL